MIRKGHILFWVSILFDYYPYTLSIRVFLFFHFHFSFIKYQSILFSFSKNQLSNVSDPRGKSHFAGTFSRVLFAAGCSQPIQSSRLKINMLYINSNLEFPHLVQEYQHCHSFQQFFHSTMQTAMLLSTSVSQWCKKHQPQLGW